MKQLDSQITVADKRPGDVDELIDNKERDSSEKSKDDNNLVNARDSYAMNFNKTKMFGANKQHANPFEQEKQSRENRDTYGRTEIKKVKAEPAQHGIVSSTEDPNVQSSPKLID